MTVPDGRLTRLYRWLAAPSGMSRVSVLLAFTVVALDVVRFAVMGW